MRITRIYSSAGFHIFEIGNAIKIIAIIHDLNQVVQYCDIVHLLSEGEHIASGKPEEIFSPKTIEQVFGFKGEVVRVNNRNILLPEG